MPVIETEHDTIGGLPDNWQEAKMGVRFTSPLRSSFQAERRHNAISQRQQPLDPTWLPPEYLLRNADRVQGETCYNQCISVAEVCAGKKPVSVRKRPGKRFRHNLRPRRVMPGDAHHWALVPRCTPRHRPIRTSTSSGKPLGSMISVATVPHPNNAKPTNRGTTMPLRVIQRRSRPRMINGIAKLPIVDQKANPLRIRPGR